MPARGRVRWRRPGARATRRHRHDVQRRPVIPPPGRRPDPGGRQDLLAARARAQGRPAGRRRRLLRGPAAGPAQGAAQRAGAGLGHPQRPPARARRRRPAALLVPRRARPGAALARAPHPGLGLDPALQLRPREAALVAARPPDPRAGALRAGRRPPAGRLPPREAGRDRRPARLRRRHRPHGRALGHARAPAGRAAARVRGRTVPALPRRDADGRGPGRGGARGAGAGALAPGDRGGRAGRGPGRRQPLAGGGRALVARRHGRHRPHPPGLGRAAAAPRGRGGLPRGRRGGADQRPRREPVPDRRPGGARAGARGSPSPTAPRWWSSRPRPARGRSRPR